MPWSGRRALLAGAGSLPAMRRGRLRGVVAVTLLATLVGACRGGPIPTGQQPGANAGRGGPPASPVSVQTVQRGPITAVLTYSGNVSARAQVNVLPQATARVAKLNVDLGTPVKAGDTLAELDRTQLDAQVQQARGVLDNATAHLALLQAGARPENVQAAQAALDSAQSRLDEMLAGGRPEEVATAQANLDSAQAKLEQLQEGSTQADIDTARAAVESSEASVRSSNEALGELMNGGSPDDQQAADAAIDTARGNLAQALARRQALRTPPADQVAQARNAVETAQSTLDAAQQRLTELQQGGSIADQVSAQSAIDSAQASLEAAQQNQAELLNGGTPADRAAARSAVDTALAAVRSARSRYDLLHGGPSAPDLANANQQLAAAQQQQTAAQQQVNAQCGGGSGCAAAQAALAGANSALSSAQANIRNVSQGASPADLEAAHAALDQANATLQAAQARLDQLNHPTPDAVQAARTAVSTAQANLDAAVARQELLRQPAPDTLAAAQSGVDIAQSSLHAGQQRLDLLLAGGAPEDQQAADGVVAAAQGELDQALARRDALRHPSLTAIANARAAVDTATANLAGAQSRLADVLAGAKAADMQAAFSGVEQAQQALVLARYPYSPQAIQQQQEAVAQARANLVLAAEPNRPEDIQQAQATVEQAQGAYNLARQQAQETVITAPFDGVVAAKLLSEGALANPTTPVVSLVTDAVEVDVTIEQARIGQIHAGTPATLAVSAFPDREFPAVVDVVAPTADQRSRTFLVRVIPTDDSGQLKDGMTAQVKISGESRPDAVLVPNAATLQRTGKTVAFVDADGKASLRQLQLGITDGTSSEVLSGLEPGDQLIVSGQESLNDGDAVRIVRPDGS